MIKRHRRIGELLMDACVITQPQLDSALGLQRQNGKKTVENLIELGCLDAASFQYFLAHQPGTPSISISGYFPTDEVLALLPGSFVREHQAFPLDRMGRILTVAMVCPIDDVTIAEIEERTGLTVHPVLCSAEDLEHAYAHHYHHPVTVFSLAAPRAMLYR